MAACEGDYAEKWNNFYISVIYCGNIRAQMWGSVELDIIIFVVIAVL
jgi:hypothetical protein